MSERIVDERFVAELEADSRRRRALDERFARLEQLLERSDEEIVGGGRLRRGLFRFLRSALVPTPLLEHRREIRAEQLRLLRELWSQASERLDSAEDRLLQLYLKVGESLSALRADILGGVEERIGGLAAEVSGRALREAREESEERHREMTLEMRRLAADLVSRTDLLTGHLEQEVAALSHDLERHVGIAGERLEGFRTDVDQMRDRLDSVCERVRMLTRELAPPAPPAPSSGKAAEGEAGTPPTDAEYAAHQDRFRGSPDEIARRQRLYIDYFRQSAPVLDVGCGRGEFLELLAAEGIEAYGIDVNSEIVKANKERGLKVIKADLLKHLKKVKGGTLGGIFAAQVAEHLDGPRLRTFLREAHRALKDGGVLIAETINPESVFALTRFFYLDASHHAPLPSELLRFYAEQAGFAEVEIRKLSEVPEAERLQPVELEAAAPAAIEAAFRRLNRDIERLNDFLYGYLEYAVVAIK